MTMEDPGSEVAVLVAHARSVDLDARERFRQELAGHAPAGHVVLATCHRVEAYLAGRPDRLAITAPPGAEVLEGEAAARHAIEVAVGLDSVVVGEDQVLHQLRTAVADGRRRGALDPSVDRLLGLALRAGRRARSWRQGPPPSLADAALDLVESRAGTVRGRPLLVVGAGEMGRLAAAAGVRRGAAVTIASPTTAHASAVARDLGAAVGDVDPGMAASGYAAVLVALRGPWVVGRRAVDALAASPGLVVDLSVPLAVPPALRRRLGPRFLPGDALLAAVPAARTQLPVAPRIERLVDETLAEYRGWAAARSRRAAAAALAQLAEEERRAELEALWRRLPDLRPEARAEIDRMSRHLADRLLREPLEKLGRDADGRTERAARELFTL